MTAKSKSKQEEALQFLDDLDSLSPDAAPAGVNASVAAAPNPSNPGEAAEVLAFLDEITQKSSEPTRTTTTHIERPLSRAGTPTLRKSAERVKVGAPTPLMASSGSSSSKGASPSSSSTNVSTSATATKQDPPSQQSGGWGWGSVWTSASSALQQAKSAVDEQVKHLPKQEQARKWSEGMMEYAKNAQLEKIGQDFKRVGLSTLTEILNAVAPPISEHEVIQVWLSHDMKGYDGVESLVYNALTRVMEQVDGGDLIVNRGNESKPKESSKDSEREMNAVEGFEPALKLAQANLEELIKNNKAPAPAEPTSVQNPTSHSYVYLRIQPFTTHFNLPEPSSTTSSHLQFIIHLSDPAHQLVHTTITQAVPDGWMDLWNDYDWVEDLVAEALRVGVEVVGQEYIVARMGWTKKGETADENQARSQAT
ncbi:hypothetical protein EW146_g3875 [Bondarzewia mesenterica]|uniref:Maintenance of telomere capping protein 1 n=1 Tax=Bondarzewia mesenterica TaxID=1095465 RepID=A0A4S4LY31_9AGAM|nr:hypothetical protein EW146_g3875 [Bondarzewia mesenterica]